DEADLRSNIGRFLERQGFSVETAGEGTAAAALLREPRFDAAVIDIRMNGKSGLEGLSDARAGGVETPVILMTAYATVDSVGTALRPGASDYLLKPFELDTLAAKLGYLVEERRRTPAAARETVAANFPTLVAKSEAMERVLRLASHVAPTASTVLLTGE